MKLSELIAFRNRLDKLPVSDATLAANQKLDILMHAVKYPHEMSMAELTQPFVPALDAKLKEINTALDNFSVEVEQLRQHVKDQIEEKERHWFQESYKLFEEAELCEKTDQILYGRRSNEKSERTLESEDTLRSRLSAYGDWRWPGMIIRPGIENFVDTMVGCDPLYLVDREYDLLKPCLDRFPKLYQNRLRPYTTNDWSDRPILERIPDNQFGVCLAYRVFDYRPLEIIRRYLEEIYQKLRPGGVLLMTYNDCDLAHAVMLVEQFAASYTPGYLIRNLTQAVGFELAYSWSDGGPSVWLELHKPGELTSNRGGQAIAKIHSRFDYSEDVDFLKRKVYTKEEIVNLREQARSYGINDKVIKRSQPYDLYTMIQDVIELRKEEERISKWREVAIKHNIELSLPNWQDLVEKILDREAEEQRVAREKAHLEHLKQAAIARNVDLNSPDWRYHIEAILQKEADDERRRIEKEKLEKLQQQAQDLNIDINVEGWKIKLQEAIEAKRLEDLRIELETKERLALEADQRKKEELAQLRQRALELQVGDPNLIRYGYSAEKLKQLIKAKEEK